MLTKTDAIVLKAMKYRDTSKIVTFYTRRFGKLKGIAKGARQIKSKFGAALEPMTCVSLVLYKKEHRDLQLVSQCDIARPYKRIHSEFDRMTVGLAIVELVNQLAHDEEENLPLYSLLTETLDELERAAKNVINILYAFELRLVGLFGFAPALNSCRSCGRLIDEFAGEGSAIFQLSKGAILCPRCGMQVKQRIDEHGCLDNRRVQRRGALDQGEVNVRMSAPALRVMQRLSAARMGSLPALEYTKATGNEIDATLRLYLRQHFEDMKPLKSLEIYKETFGEHSPAKRKHVCKPDS